MQRLRRSIAVPLMSLAAHSAHAWNGARDSISAVDSVPAVGNYDSQVLLRDQYGQWCGSSVAGAAGWAALKSNDPNIKGLQVTLMLAVAMGKTVTPYANRHASGYCKLGYVAVAG